MRRPRLQTPGSGIVVIAVVVGVVTVAVVVLVVLTMRTGGASSSPHDAGEFAR